MADRVPEKPRLLRTYVGARLNGLALGSRVLSRPTVGSLSGMERQLKLLWHCTGGTRGKGAALITEDQPAYRPVPTISRGKTLRVPLSGRAKQERPHSMTMQSAIYDHLAGRPNKKSFVVKTTDGRPRTVARSGAPIEPSMT
jgi:hypothetical protein